MTFWYKKNQLFVEGISVHSLADRLGTPLYVYSADSIRSRYLQFKKAFQPIRHLLCYAVKANSNTAILRLLGGMGAGMDIVSQGELARATQSGIHPSRVVFSGVGKTAQEMRTALRAGILMFNVESEEELMALHRVAQSMRKPAPISFRVNPNVNVDTHHHIATGQGESKFGVPIAQVESLYVKASRLPWIEVKGLQSHIGSQITEVRPFRETLKKLLGVVDRLGKRGIVLSFLDMGGGLGVSYNGEKPPTPNQLAQGLLPFLKNRDLCLLFEPGRFMVADSGALVTQVLYRKDNGKKKFVVVDAAMNDLARPALYDAFHPVWPVEKKRHPVWTADVVGPVCESGDFLAKDRRLPRPDPGDFLAVLMSGAYGFSMSSQYNARPRAAEVLVSGKKWWVIRKRESLEDLVRGEKIPALFPLPSQRKFLS